MFILQCLCSVLSLTFRPYRLISIFICAVRAKIKSPEEPDMKMKFNDRVGITDLKCFAWEGKKRCLRKETIQGCGWGFRGGISFARENAGGRERSEGRRSGGTTAECGSASEAPGAPRRRSIQKNWRRGNGSRRWVVWVRMWVGYACCWVWVGVTL